MFGLVNHLEVTRLTGLEQRRFGRCDEPALGVVVDEDLLRVADLVGKRNIAVGQQHLLLFLVRQKKSVFRDAAHGELLNMSGSEHTKIRYSMDLRRKNTFYFHAVQLSGRKERGTKPGETRTEEGNGRQRVSRAAQRPYSCRQPDVRAA